MAEARGERSALIPACSRSPAGAESASPPLPAGTAPLGRVSHSAAVPAAPDTADVPGLRAPGRGARPWPDGTLWVWGRAGQPGQPPGVSWGAAGRGTGAFKILPVA